LELQKVLMADPPISVEGAAGANALYIKTGGKIGMGTLNPSYSLHLTTNSTSTVVAGDSFGVGAGPGFRGRTARGTQASPSASQANDVLGYLAGVGYGSTGWLGTASSAVFAKSAENFTDSAAGGMLTFETTPLGAATRAERMRIGSDGSVGIGTTNPQVALDVNGGIRPGASTAVTTCNGTTEGQMRYNYSTHGMEFCNGASWTIMQVSTCSQ
jgi:hypothetical protein